MVGERWRGWLARLTLALLATQCGPRHPVDSAAPADTAKASARADDQAIAVGQLARGELPSQVPIEADDIIWGANQAPVTLVVFVDFQCQFCARAHKSVQELQARYGPDRLRVVFKHLPLDFHQDAFPTAVALQAVRELGGQDAALALVDELLADQTNLSEQRLLESAEAAGVPRARLARRLSDQRLFKAVDNDIALARRHGIDGTPTFLVNGYKLVGALPLEEFVKTIDRELAAVAELAAAGTAPQEIYALRVIANSQAEPADERDTTIYRVPIEGSPTLGPDDALVTIVEFSEFQCPFCKRVQSTLEQLRERFPHDVRFVFKHLPLGFHEHALPAARLTAEIQRISGNDAFWKAADALFEGELQQDRLLLVAAQFGLSRAQAMSAIAGTSGQTRVDSDLNLSQDLEARGTPHFFINGRRLAGARPYAEFEAMVLTAIREARAELTSHGIGPSDYYAHLMQNADPLHAPRKVDTAIPNEGHPAWGPKTAPVVIHAFSDFECGYCARVEPILSELRESYGNRLRIVWHNLPLAFHRQARPAARAALEAYAQEGDPGFRKMHEKLFASHKGEAGPALSHADLLGYAKDLGLDLRRFETALADGRHDPAIDADVAVAQAIGIEGTPGFVVNGWLSEGAKPLRYFQALIERALAAAAAPGRIPK